MPHLSHKYPENQCQKAQGKPTAIYFDSKYFSCCHSQGLILECRALNSGRMWPLSLGKPWEQSEVCALRDEKAAIRDQLCISGLEPFITHFQSLQSENPYWPGLPERSHRCKKQKSLWASSKENGNIKRLGQISQNLLQRKHLGQIFLYTRT